MIRWTVTEMVGEPTSASWSVRERQMYIKFDFF